MSLVCPRCVAYRPTKFCGDCGGQTCNENQCSQCGSVTPNCLFCPQCGAPLYKQLVKQGGGGGGGYGGGHGGGYGQPKQVHPRDMIGGRTEQPPVFFQEGVTVRPSEVHKGVSAAEDDGLSRYRAQFNADKDEDEISKEFLAKYPVSRVGNVPNTKPTYSSSSSYHSSAVRQKPPPASSVLRGNQQPYHGGTGGGVWGAKYGGSPSHQQPQYNPDVVKESTVRPSLAKQTGDDLDKYRLKWEVQLKDIPATDKPVTVSVGGNLVISSYGSGGKVREEVSTGPSGDAVFEINVPAISAVPFRQDLKFENGRFVRFSVADGTLTFKQGSLDFE